MSVQISEVLECTVVSVQPILILHQCIVNNKEMVMYVILMQIVQPVLLVAGLLPLRLVHVYHDLLHHHRHHNRLALCQHNQIVQDLGQARAHPDYVKNLVHLIININAVQLMEVRMAHIVQIYK